MPEQLEVTNRSARAWLDSVRKASARIECLVRELSALRDARDEYTSFRTSGSGCGSSHGTHSDPTAAQAEAHMVQLEALIADRAAALGHAQSVVGWCLRVLDGMRRDLGERHAMAIELYYVDLAPTWSDVADEMRCDRTTVWRLRTESYAWIERVHSLPPL